MKRTHWTVLLGAVALVAVAVAACQPPAPALGTEENPIVFSFTPATDAGAVLASATQLTDKMSELTGLVIKPNVPTSYVAAIEAICAGESQAGALNTFSYVLAHQRECANVALVSVRNDAPTYTGQIVTRADSGITTIEDLKGKTFCRPDEFSTSGWIIPSLLMRAHGVNPDTDLAEVKDAGGHDGVIRSVYNKECDAGATFSDARSTVATELTDVMDVVTVIATTDPIPNDTILFRPDFPTDMRDKIVQALLDMTKDEASLAIMQDLYRWGGLQAVDDSFYDPFRQLIEAAGVNLEDYVK